MITFISVVLFAAAFAVWTLAFLIALNPGRKLKPAVEDNGIPRGGTVNSSMDTVRAMSRSRDQVMALSVIGLVCALLAVYLLTAA